MGPSTYIVNAKTQFEMENSSQSKVELFLGIPTWSVSVCVHRI